MKLGQNIKKKNSPRRLVDITVAQLNIDLHIHLTIIGLEYRVIMELGKYTNICV